MFRLLRMLCLILLPLAAACRHGGEGYVPSKEASQLNNRAYSLIATDPQKAIELLDQALEKDPEYWTAMGNRAAALGRLGRHDEAAAQLEAVVQIYPRIQRAKYIRGIYLERAGNPEAARAAYQAAVDGLTEDVKRKPGAPDPYCERALALFLLGETEQASQSLDAIERQLPDDRKVLAMRKLLLNTDRDRFVANYGGAMSASAAATQGPAAEAPAGSAQ